MHTHMRVVCMHISRRGDLHLRFRGARSASQRQQRRRRQWRQVLLRKLIVCAGRVRVRGANERARLVCVWFMWLITDRTCARACVCDAVVQCVCVCGRCDGIFNIIECLYTYGLYTLGLCGQTLYWMFITVVVVVVVSKNALMRGILITIVARPKVGTHTHTHTAATIFPRAFI